MNEPGAPIDPVWTPQVIANYAAYLHTKTRTLPEMTMTGAHAEVSVSVKGKTLVLTFQHHRREWSLDSAEIRRGDRTATFTRGQLAEAVAALLRP